MPDEPLVGKSTDHTEKIRKMRAARLREIAAETGQPLVKKTVETQGLPSQPK